MPAANGRCNVNIQPRRIKNFLLPNAAYLSLRTRYLLLFTFSPYKKYAIKRKYRHRKKKKNTAQILMDIRRWLEYILKTNETIFSFFSVSLDVSSGSTTTFLYWRLKAKTKVFEPYFTTNTWLVGSNIFFKLNSFSNEKNTSEAGTRRPLCFFFFFFFWRNFLFIFYIIHIFNLPLKHWFILVRTNFSTATKNFFRNLFLKSRHRTFFQT